MRIIFRVGKHTVRGQYLLVMIVTILASVSLLGFFSFEVIRDVVQSRGRANMMSAVEMISDDMEREYSDVLQISQHMMPSGRVGLDMNMVLSAASMFDQGEAKRMLARDLSLITFSIRQSELALYCSEDGTEVYTSTMSVKPSFHARSNLPILGRSGKLIYNAIHTSQSYISNHPVISITREAQFFDDRVYTIYVEMRTALRDSIDAMSQSTGLDYIYLQLNDSGEICFSSDASFAAGHRIGDELTGGEFGYLGDYVWARSDARFGLHSVIALHKDQFYSDIFRWVRRFLIALAAAILLIAGSAILLNWLVLRKMQIMIRAIDRIGQDSLELSPERTGLAEYDLLLDRFDLMIARIRQLVADVEMKEAERARVELEKLYYQINPHFLMNSLNSVHWLARMSGQDDIRDMVHHLSLILSYSLGRMVEHPTLRSELDILKSYIKIESNRHSFHTTLDIEEGAYLDMQSPRLILQPLVENAIGHGMNVGGQLRVQVNRAQDGAVVTIVDDGCGLSEEMVERLNNNSPSAGNGGVGLRYVRSMLEQFYGNRSSIHFDSSPDQGTVVTLHLGCMKGVTPSDSRADC